MSKVFSYQTLSVKLTMKILSMFTAFSENMNFKTFHFLFFFAAIFSPAKPHCFTSYVTILSMILETINPNKILITLGKKKGEKVAQKHFNFV